jgi:hypothetical protein
VTAVVHVAEWPAVTDEEHAVEDVPAGCTRVATNPSVVDDEADAYERDDVPLKTGEFELVGIYHARYVDGGALHEVITYRRPATRPAHDDEARRAPPSPRSWQACSSRSPSRSAPATSSSSKASGGRSRRSR